MFVFIIYWACLNGDIELAYTCARDTSGTRCNAERDIILGVALVLSYARYQTSYIWLVAYDKVGIDSLWLIYTGGDPDAQNSVSLLPTLLSQLKMRLYTRTQMRLRSEFNGV